MDNAGAIEHDSGTNARARCANCGFDLASGASFCGSCGASVAEPFRMNAQADLNLAVALFTLALVLWMLLWLAKPLYAVGVDPVASLRTTLQYSGLWTAVMLPIIALLASVIYLSWKGRRTAALSGAAAQPGDAGCPHCFCSDTRLFVATLVWLYVSLLLRSETGSNILAGLGWLLFTGLLAVLCLAVLGAEANKIWKTPRVPRTVRMLGYLSPFPVAAVLLFAIVPGDAPARIRFDVSEDELTRYIDEFEWTDGVSMPAIQMVGLYNLGVPGPRGDCVTLTTNSGLDYYAGFAYCTGPPPEKPNVHFHHFKGNWWKFEVYH